MIEVETHLNIAVVLVLRGAAYVRNLRELASPASTLTPQHVRNGRSSLLVCHTVRPQTVWGRRVERSGRLNDKEGLMVLAYSLFLCEFTCGRAHPALLIISKYYLI